ncbi:glycosyltransferase family A protein [Tunturibacter empetritectus]|uniref:Glycosyltransferase involved in cell wall biosynthesis n=1 Tax=Tunturiibacter lichenicola TaxID=2051959 RepID=A0A7W8J850_9BACT|nr:glycosyltransferase family A protein [Edaphobacter lichenicola]MBB5344385.1 glycosyltransferase involved in cell wall biosynthesis [Edaphobacter lichenicola]
MMLEALTIAAMLCSLAPAVLFCVNWRRYLPPPQAEPSYLPALSVLIPARDEEDGIAAVVESVLASTGVSFEVIVMDDCSSDRTADIVEAIAKKDARVRLERTQALPSGWNGKQHTCWTLALAARHELLCFVDADVRLKPECLARMTVFLQRGRRGLVTGFPQQATETWLERLLLPLIHFVLLGFLPVERMRNTTDPAFAAGCGQFILVRREDYFACGGHAEIKTTMHDGLLLPRLFRQYGYRTDLADLTDLATCRMYRNALQVWQGLAKNATEGLASPVRILPISLLLFLGQIVPFMLAAWLLLVRESSVAETVYVLIAITGAWLPRFMAAYRFRQSWRGACLHPLDVGILLAVQWYALTRKITGGSVRWKERSYSHL